MIAARTPGRAAAPPRTAGVQARATARRPAHAGSAVENAAARETLAPLHNMSAPPRATITFRALAGPHVAEDGDRAAGSGLRWVCRIDLPGVFRPVPEGMARDPAEPLMWAHTLELERSLLAHALAEERGSKEPDAALRREVDTLPAEALHEALREAAARADPIALGLPGFGLLRPVRPTAPRRRTEAMRLALAVLSRRRGDVFLAGADPLSPSSLYQPLDLWAVEPPPQASVDPAADPRAEQAASGPALTPGSAVGIATSAPSSGAGAAARAVRRPDAGPTPKGGNTP